MSAEQNHGSNGESGITRTRITVVTLMYDHETNLVALDGHGAIISLVQMMLDEALRQLDIQRRQAAAIELQKQIADAKRTAAIVEGLKFPR